MSKLSEHFLTVDDFYEVADTVDAFELQDIQKAVGEDIFLNLLDALDELENVDDVILIYGIMDKLLSTNRNDLVEYHDEIPTLRYKTTTEEKEGVMDILIDKKIHYNTRYLIQELPTIGRYPVTAQSLKLVNGLVALNVDSLKDIVKGTSLVEEFISLLESEGMKPEDLIDVLYKADKLASEGDEEVKDFFNTEQRDSKEIIIELIEIKDK